LREFLNKKKYADAFRGQCERNRWNSHLDRATEQIYLAALAFYRSKRGKGAEAVDVSNFFYRANLDKAFESFWAGKLNTRRSVVSQAIAKFKSELVAEADR
jgi:hypothetical protein